MLYFQSWGCRWLCSSHWELCSVLYFNTYPVSRPYTAALDPPLPVCKIWINGLAKFITSNPFCSVSAISPNSAQSGNCLPKIFAVSLLICPTTWCCCSYVFLCLEKVSNSVFSLLLRCCFRSSSLSLPLLLLIYFLYFCFATNNVFNSKWDVCLCFR